MMNLKIMLNDLNEKLDTQLKLTFDLLIKKYNNNQKLTINDMIYSLDKLYPDIKFKPVDIIQTIMLLLSAKFNIKFKQLLILEAEPEYFLTPDLVGIHKSHEIISLVIL